jgi:hypothetical protein
MYISMESQSHRTIEGYYFLYVSLLNPGFKILKIIIFNRLLIGDVFVVVDSIFKGIIH